MLFATRASNRGCTFGILVGTLFKDLKKAKGTKHGILPLHEQNEYHKTAMLRADSFALQELDPNMRIDVQILNQQETEYENNKYALESIVECILYCGKQGIALLGHRDDATADCSTNRGNFIALLEFRSKTDERLKSFMDNPCDAQYTSKVIHNEVIDIIGGIVRESITKNLTDTSPYFSIIADELTDPICNQQVLCICLRYLKYNTDIPAMCESFIDMSYIERGTSESLKNVIFERLVQCGLKKENMRGQAYDTTATMSSDANGLQARIRQDVPKAIYSPCNAHTYNLVIANASKLMQIKNCVGVVNETYLFFKASPKRQRFFEQVIGIVNKDSSSKVTKLVHVGLCKTCWVERFEAFDSYVDLLEAIATTCDLIVYPHLYIHDADLNELVQESWDWDADTKTRTQGILASVRNFEFAVSLVTLKNVLEPLRGITAKLQKRDLDIDETFCNIDSAIDDVTSNRLNVDIRYPVWYQEMFRISKSAGGEEKLPRIAAKQLHRANHPANTAIDFYGLSLVIPFIDEVLAELKNRFSEDAIASIKGLLQLVPAKIVSIEQQDLKSIIQNLNMYHEDLPRYEGLYVELEIWKDK